MTSPSDAEWRELDERCRKVPRLRKYWIATPDDWKCPGCDRTKRQCVWWGSSSRYPGGRWQAWIRKHRDHGALKYGSVTVEGFLPDLVCADCSRANAEIKALLVLPRDFTFAPSEIRRFVRPIPHERHKIYPVVARAIYKKGKLFNWAERRAILLETLSSIEWRLREHPKACFSMIDNEIIIRTVVKICKMFIRHGDAHQILQVSLTAGSIKFDRLYFEPGGQTPSRVDAANGVVATTP